jgi:hypothetical protein
MPEILKPASQPDWQKIAGMMSRVVFASKVVSNSGPEKAIVVGQKGWSADQIMDWIGKLPQTPGAGPGMYHFVVAEEGGDAKSEWRMRLGDGPGEESTMGPNGSGTVGMDVGGAPTSYRQLGGGFLYSEDLGILVTPAKQIFEWRPGQPLPGAVGTGGFGNLQFGGGSSSTVPGAGFPPWGSMPVTADDGSKRELAELKRALEEQKAERREDARRAEAKTQQDAMMATIAKMQDDANKRFEALVAALSSKPAGPSPEAVAMQAQVEELRRQALAAEQARREDALRHEIAAGQARTEALVREATAHKPDPMLPLITELIRSGQAASQSATEASEKSIDQIMSRLSPALLTPEKTLDFLRMAKDNTGNDVINKGMVEMFSTAFGMSQKVLEMQSEMLQSSGGPAWLPAVENGVAQLGRVATAMIASRAASQRPAPVQQPAPQPQQQARPAAPAAAPAPAAPGKAKRKPAAAAAPAPAAEGAPQYTPAQIAKAKKELREANPDELRTKLAGVDDATFWGPFAPYVEQLRTDVAAGTTKADEAADMVMQAADQFEPMRANMAPLPCIELLEAEQIDVLVEHLLPAAEKPFRVDVADKIRVALRAAAAGGDDEDGE